jgi:hypothetical protein
MCKYANVKMCKWNTVGGIKLSGSSGLVVPKVYYVACGDQCVAKSDIIQLRNCKFRRATDICILASARSLA